MDNVLYNWFAALKNGGSGVGSIAPSGWHVSLGFEDCQSTMQFLDPDGTFTVNDAGNQMKTSGTIDWNADSGATNSSGFNGKGSGIRDDTGQFLSTRELLMFWAPSPFDDEVNKCVAKLHYGLSIFSCPVDGSGSETASKNFGTPIRLVKDSTILINGQTGTVTIDGYIYQTICIGTREWLAENLKTTKYNDGTPIPIITDNAAWAADTTGAMCYYDNVFPEIERIFSESEYIKIPFGGSLVLKFFNPLFNDISSYSLPMSFNGNIPYIKRAFGYPDKREAEVKSNIEGRIKTRFLDLIGSWCADETSEDNISAYFKPGSGDFYSMIKDVLLSDLDFGGVRWPIYEGAVWAAMPIFLNTKMDVSYPDSDYCAYCAYMPNAVNVDNSDDVKLINEVILPEEGPIEFKNQNGNTAVYLFAGTVIDYLFSNYGYKIEENIFRKDPDLKKLTIFNTFNLRPPASSEFFQQARIDYQKLVPHITCSDFLKAIRNKFNIGFFINEQQRSVRIRSFDSIISDGVRFAICNTRPKKPIVENNRLPGIKFPLNEPDAWSAHSYKTTDELKNPIIVSKYRDILPETRAGGDLIFVQSETAYYRIKYTIDPEAWEAIRVSTDQFPYIEGNNPQEITQLSGIPAMYTHTLNQEYIYYHDLNPYTADTDVDFLIPRCDLVGNGYKQQFTEFPLMFLFARGIVNCFTVQATFNPNDPIQEYANMAAFPNPGVTGIRYFAIDTQLFYRWNGLDYFVITIPEPAEPPIYSYPLGTSDVYNADGTKISTVDLALKWGGDYGLIKRFWTNRINWELNIKKLIKTELLNDDIARLIDMDEWKRVGDDNYLVNSFQIKVENKKVRLQDVELLRL